MDLVKAVHFLVVGKEHVGVDLVDEDLVGDFLGEAVGHLDDVAQSQTGSIIFLLLSVYDVNQTAACLDSLNIVRIRLLELGGARVVTNLELDERVIVDF